MPIEKQSWGQYNEQKEAILYTLTNTNGMVAKISNYGGTVTHLIVPSADGKMVDVALGYESLDEYVSDSPYFGCICGRYANRICNGKFTLDGQEYELAVNNGPNALHGGLKGFDKVLWASQEYETQEGPALKLSYISGDKEEGYPGTLTCIVTYTVTNDNALKIEYQAVTDKTTVINLTNHTYFNLGGYNSGNVLKQELMIAADNYLPVDETSIPIGEIQAVAEGPMDFTTMQTIGSRIDQVEGGYDHNYCLNSQDGSLALGAKAKCERTGIVMEMYTTEPGVQLYSGNYLDDSLSGKGAVYGKHHGFCLETQHYPDSPNREEFPSVVLKPGETYTQTTCYKFSVEG